MSNDLSPNDGVSVTVLICTSGRPELLARALASLAEGVEVPDQVVIVNGSDPQTPEVVAGHASRFHNLVLIEHPNRNLATLRNLGLPHCTSEIIAMTDDDALPDAGWIAAIRRTYAKRPDVGGIGGMINGVSQGFLSRLAGAVVFPKPRAGQRIETLPTVNMSYPKTVVDAVGAFDESLFRGEDVDFNWRVLQLGKEIQYDPTMRVRHEHRRTVRGFLQQQWMYGRAYVLVRTKWPAMYCVYPHSLRSVRSWLKLAYSVAAIFMQPLTVAASLRSADRMLAYPVLVAHHAIWKLGMLRQWIYLLHATRGPSSESHMNPRVTRWADGRSSSE